MRLASFGDIAIVERRQQTESTLAGKASHDLITVASMEA